MESNVQRCQVRLQGVQFLQQLAALAILGTRWHVESKWPLLGHEHPRKGDLFLIVNKYLNKVLVCKKPEELCPSRIFVWPPGVWQYCSPGLSHSSCAWETSVTLPVLPATTCAL